MTDIRLIVFDCDGTLVDSQHMIAAAMRRAFEGQGIVPPDATAVRRLVGLSLVDAIAALTPDLGLDMHLRLADGYKAAFRDLRHGGLSHEPLFDGVRDLLEELNGAGYLLGVATGKGRQGLTKVLELHDILHYFVTLQTADRHPSKPHPAMLQAAMDETGAVPTQTVVVGDTTYDMEMAVGAKAHALGVAWGYHGPEELRAAGAAAMAEVASDVARLAAKMLEGRKAAAV